MRPLWLSFLILLVLAPACKRDTPTTPSPPPPTQPVIYSALGASDGLGVGGSVVCLPLDPTCSGTGYVYLLTRRLQTDGRMVTLRNISLPGAVLSPAIQALSRDIGRDILANFLDQEAPFVLNDSTHVTFFVGGNDANVIAQNIRAGRGAADIRGFIDQHVNQWGQDLNELIRRIRARAPNARIVALNLPNVAALPYVSGNTTQERSVLQRIAVSLTDRINALTSQNVIVVDLMCEPRIYSAANVSSDGFHPSDAGYALMADLTYPALANGTATPPSSTCAPRTAFPIF